jgi:hypothetical protein
MKTFFNILQTIINVKNKKYPDDPFAVLQEYNNNCNESYVQIWSLINDIFYIEKSCNIIFKNKYKKTALAKIIALNNIINNIFYTNEHKETIINIFSNAQKYYYAFSKLARIYKINKYKFIVTDDLSMNPIDVNGKNTFMLLENNAKYLFSLNDLVSIIETAISNAPNFFSEPLQPLNPYNNQPFTDSTLYNIYFKMKESERLISVLFHFFFLENFVKSKFSEHYEPHIREHAIKKYIFNSPYTMLYNSTLNMLMSNVYTKNYKIHKDFPKDILVDIFRPFLFYYYIVHYDIKGTNKVVNYACSLAIKLKKFYLYNTSFGRRYIKTTTRFNKIIKQEYKFNTNHIDFNKINCCLYTETQINDESDYDSDYDSDYVSEEISDNEEDSIS